MKTAIDSVNAYYEAFSRKDLSKLREILAEDFTFTGPMMSFNNAEAFIQAVATLPFQGTFEKSRFVGGDNRVAHAFVWKIAAPAKTEIPMCEFFEVSGRKIRSAQLFYDSKLFPAATAQG